VGHFSNDLSVFLLQGNHVQVKICHGRPFSFRKTRCPVPLFIMTKPRRDQSGHNTTKCLGLVTDQ
jgi:hypothetical protein